jgi:hypothetical protein
MTVVSGRERTGMLVELVSIEARGGNGVLFDEGTVLSFPSFVARRL